MSKRKKKIKEPLDFNKCKEFFDKVIEMVKNVAPNQDLLVFEMNETDVQQKNKLQRGLRLNCKYKLLTDGHYQAYSFFSHILIYGNKYIRKVAEEHISDAFRCLFLTQLGLGILGQSEMQWLLDYFIDQFSNKVLLSVLDRLEKYYTGEALARLKSIQLLYDLKD